MIFSDYRVTGLNSWLNKNLAPLDREATFGSKMWDLISLFISEFAPLILGQSLHLYLSTRKLGVAKLCLFDLKRTPGCFYFFLVMSSNIQGRSFSFISWQRLLRNQAKSSLNDSWEKQHDSARKFVRSLKIARSFGCNFSIFCLSIQIV